MQKVSVADVLTYKQTPTNDQIMDFSQAGYMGGGVAIPLINNNVITVNPSGNIDDEIIQNAINQVSSNGGVVLLSQGTYTITQTLNITASGVILRGQTDGNGNNLVNVQLKNLTQTQFSFLQLGDYTQEYIVLDTSTQVGITNTYVPSGTNTINVASVSAFSPKDQVLVERVASQKWINAVGMGNGNWVQPGAISYFDRAIVSVNSQTKTLTLDAPLSDSIDATLNLQGYVVHYIDHRLNHIGVEFLNVIAPYRNTTVEYEYTDIVFNVINVTGLKNSWIRNITANNFISGIRITGNTKYMTLEHLKFVNVPPADINGPKQFQIYLDVCSFILVNKCQLDMNPGMTFVTEALTTGPNVILYSYSPGDVNWNARLSPHQRWGTGLLVDNYQGGNGAIDIGNRGTTTSGSLQGWAMAWSVTWNSQANFTDIEQPDSAYNWVIGLKSNISIGNATNSYYGTTVGPQSLYLAQLCERLGRAAVSAIGY